MGERPKRLRASMNATRLMPARVAAVPVDTLPSSYSFTARRRRASASNVSGLSLRASNSVSGYGIVNVCMAIGISSVLRVTDAAGHRAEEPTQGAATFFVWEKNTD